MTLGTPITKRQAREAAEAAQRCVAIIRQWLPVEGRGPLSSNLTMDEWYSKAGHAMIDFRKHHPTPGRYHVAGPQDFDGYWRELADGMMAIVDHYGWHDVDGENKIPHSDVRGGQQIEAIDPALLDRVDQSAQWLIDLAPESDDELAEFGVELWNSGKTWREVTVQLHPETEVDDALIESTRQVVNRFAKKHNRKLREGTPGRRRK